MAYTEDYLLNKLKDLLDKYGEIKTQLIDDEPNIPTRKCYIRAFGSIKNACELIGYYNYRQGSFTIEDAQNVLDQRNGNFKLLNYNGMRSKNLTKCKTCGYEWNVSTDSLLRNHTPSHGCPNCNRQLFINKLKDNNLTLLKHLGNNKYQVECNYCHTIFEGLGHNLSDPQFICKYCSPEQKNIKINTHKRLYHKSTVQFNEFLLHLKQIIDEQSVMWFYCLGLLFADGHFDTNTNRVTITLQSKDIDTLNAVAEFLHCKLLKYDDYVEINFCGKYVIENLIQKYKINNQKTYNPCDISSISHENMIAFIIGFIDGDGCIKKRTDSDLYNITIKLHKSWENNLNFMVEKLYTFFNVTKIPHTITVKDKDREYVEIVFGNSIVLNGLMDFIQQHNLPVIRRKWNKILFSKKYKKHALINKESDNDYGADFLYL